MRGQGRFFASCSVFFTCIFGVTQSPGRQETVGCDAQAGMVVAIQKTRFLFLLAI
jgi:hypothetical protein